MRGYTHKMTTSEKIEFYVVRVPESTCWYWNGSIHPVTGYGKISIGYGAGGHKTYLAHRISYEHHKGPIPKGLHVDHLCREKSCINPAHLEPVTPSENSLRGLNSRLRVPTTHCPHGHAYTPENTRFSVKGHRLCLMCRKTVHNETRKPKRRKGYPNS